MHCSSCNLKFMKNFTCTSQFLIELQTMCLVLHTAMVTYNNISLALEGKREGGGVQIDTPFLALNFSSLTDNQKLWYNCSL